MKALFIHAHFDDYEFTASGTFELWRRKLGEHFEAKVLVCTDGKAGHHFRTREETGRIRLEEQAASAQIGGYEFELLRLPNGQPPREACLQVTPDLLAALWKAIRDFEPDYLFCPPLGGDPLAGIHNDHETIAEAVRRVAYMINVPHAFTPEYPADETQSRAVQGAGDHQRLRRLHVRRERVRPRHRRRRGVRRDRRDDVVSPIADHRMAAVGGPARHGAAGVARGVEVTLRARFDRKNRELGIDSPHAVEVFRVTAWGVVPTLAQLTAISRRFFAAASNLAALEQRLRQWGA